MRRLSNTFLRVSMILSLVFLGLWLISGTVMFVLASLKDLLLESINNGNQSTSGDPEIALAIAQATLIAVGVMFVLFGLVCIPCAVISAKAKDTKNKGLLIAAMVLSICSFTWVGVPAAVLGILAINRENRQVI